MMSTSRSTGLPVVSPYLTAVVALDAAPSDSGYAVDTGLGVVRLEATERAVLRALWPLPGERPDGPVAALGEVAEQVGAPRLAAALHSLHRQGILHANRAQAEASFRSKLEAGLPGIPFLDHVELTNRCPFRCAFCERGRPGGVGRPQGLMDLGLFEGLLDQRNPAQRHYRGVELNHMGESLLHPELPAFVSACATRGLAAELSCNPTLLDPTLAKGLLDAGLRRIVVSMDAMDDPTLSAIRGPAARWAQAASNVDALLELLSGCSNPPAVVVQMLNLRRNRSQRESFLRRWGNTGLPTVQAYVKPLDGPDPGDGAADERGHDKGKDSQRRWRTGDALTAPARPDPLQPGPLRALCTFPWRSVVVLWDGQVVPCCRDARGKLVLGDLREQTLSEIWAGPRAVALRDLLASGAKPPGGHLCAQCPWSRQAFGAGLQQRHPDLARPDPLRW